MTREHVPKHSHKAPGQGGVLEQLAGTVEEMDTDGAAGTVPTSQGDGSLSMDEISGNTPDWQEDGNSPVTETGASATYNLNSTYDLIKVELTLEANYSQSRTGLHLIVEGDTGTNYDYWRLDGTETTGSDFINVAFYQPSDPDVLTTEFNIAGRWAYACGYQGPSLTTDSFGGQAVVGQNTAVASPLSQFTLSDSRDNQNVDWTIRVYGRNL